MQTATQVLTEIQEVAKENTPSTRLIEAMDLGQAIRQGDIYVQSVNEDARHSGKRAKTMQLAPGNTKGSRHIVEGKVEVYERDGDALTGPLIVAKQRFDVTHPEHGHFSLPAGTYGVTYQRDFSAERAEEIRRVAD